MTTHTSILAWRILWTEEPGRLQSIDCKKVKHIWARMRNRLQVRSSAQTVLKPYDKLRFPFIFGVPFFSLCYFILNEKGRFHLTGQKHLLLWTDFIFLLEKLWNR